MVCERQAERSEARSEHPCQLHPHVRRLLGNKTGNLCADVMRHVRVPFRERCNHEVNPSGEDEMRLTLSMPFYSNRSK